MKPNRFFLTIAVLTLSLHAADEQSVTVKSSSIENRAVRVIAYFQGKLTELDCNIGFSSCTQPQPGEYSMWPAAADEGIYNDCTNVVLLKPAGAEKEKIGVYCWANEGECSIASCVKVQVETIPAVVPDTSLEGVTGGSANVAFAGCYEIVFQRWHPGNEDASPIPGRFELRNEQADKRSTDLFQMRGIPPGRNDWERLWLWQPKNDGVWVSWGRGLGGFRGTLKRDHGELVGHIKEWCDSRCQRKKQMGEIRIRKTPCTE